MKSLGPSPRYWIIEQRLKIKDTWFYWFNEGWNLLPEHPSWQRNKSRWQVPPMRHCSSICLVLLRCLFMGLAVRMTHSVPMPHEAVGCLPWFPCVSLDRQLQRGGGSALQDKELQEEVTGEAQLWKKKSQIKQTGKEIALLAAKRDCVQDLLFLSRAYFSSVSQPPFCVHTTPFPTPTLPPSPFITQLWIVRRLRGFRLDFLLWMDPGTAI